MKFLLLSDTHLRSTCPIGRKDDFRTTQYNKWKYIINTAITQNVSAILQAGDLFDIPSPSLGLITEIAEHLIELKKWDIKFLTIPGQHDQLMRSSDLSRTAMGVLNKVGLLSVIPDGKFTTEILIVHDMIGNKPLYPGHEITYAKKYLTSHPEFDLILCGDYHYPFIEKDGNRIIVNTGCLLRLTRNPDDMFRIPHFYIYNTEDKSLEKFEIEIPPVEDTFIMSDYKTDEVDRKNVIKLIERLKNRGVGIGFLLVLESYCKENNIDPEIRAVIAEALE